MKVTTKHSKLVDEHPEEAKKYAQKLHIKKEEIPFVRKIYTSEPQEPKDEKEAKKLKEEQAIVSYITTSSKDRDNEVLMPSGMRAETYENSGKPVFWGHSYREPTHVVGQNQWLKPDKEGRGIIAKTAFRDSEFASNVYKLYSEDLTGQGPILRGFSVGFIPLKIEEPTRKGKEDTETPSKIYHEWELLEYSCVPLQSNRDCVSIIGNAYAKGFLTSQDLKKDLEEVFEIEILDTPDESEVKDFQEEIEIIEDTGQAKTMTPDELKEHYTRQEVIEIVDDDELAEGYKANAELDKKMAKEFDVALEDGLEGAKEKEDDAKENIEPPTQEEVEEAIVEKMAKIITKPETTDQYHRIPVSEGHGGHRIRTITVSASKGIKALYCGECKKIITYLFDVNKWTMESARQWVNDHKKALERYERKIIKVFENESKQKKRWNKSVSIRFDRESTEPAEIPDDFDIEDVEVMPSGFRYLIYSKYLKCKVKNIYWNSHLLPFPLLGNLLSALKEVLKEFDLKDVRNFTNRGQEAPPHYETIQLNSKRKEDLLIDGTCFYSDDEKRFVIELEPDYRGIRATVVVSDEYKCWSGRLWSNVHKWAKENNFLKGEKFALNGEFLSKGEESWDDLKLKDGIKKPIKKSLDALQLKGQGLDSRGLMFIGKPGTGKTMTGRVILNEFDTTFIWISSKDMMRMSVHYALALAFEMARDLAPTILFIEDIDAWFHSYGTINDLLKTEMDGLKQNKGIITILTSNFPELLPDALLDRPGRFHHIIEFELPTKQYRKEMLLEWTDSIDEKVLNSILEETEGFSGAHIKELVKFAEMIAEEDGVEIGEALLKSLKRLKDQKELIDQIRENKKGLETSLRELFGMKKKEIENIEETEVSEEIETDETVSEKAGEESLVPEETAFCECVKCGAKAPAVEASCAKTKCPKCGGKMRTAKKEAKEEEEKEKVADKLEAKIKIMDMDIFKEWSQKIEDELAELKEGRILSTKNRTLVKEVIDNIAELKKKLEKLYVATEPSPKVEEEKAVETEEEVIEIEEIKEEKQEKPEEEKEIDGKATTEMIADAIKKALTPKALSELTRSAVGDEFARIRGIVKTEEEEKK